MALETLAQIVAAIQATDGVAVTYGAASTYGHLEVLDEVILDGGQVLAGVPSVLVATGALTGLAVGSAITVGGTAYAIREHRRIRDGKLTMILLLEA